MGYFEYYGAGFCFFGILTLKASQSVEFILMSLILFLILPIMILAGAIIYWNTRNEITFPAWALCLISYIAISWLVWNSILCT